MKAVRLHAFGGLDQFHYEDAPDPVPGAGEVLVKVEASSLNTVELYGRQGYLQQMYPMTLPAILGSDIAGTVAAVGEGVTDFAVGDRVIAKLEINGRGAQAEYAIATLPQLAHLPSVLSFEQGATLSLAGLTGRRAVLALNVQAGDRILVTGALGAVGRVAVQYLKELGAVPVAAVRPERLDEARALTGEALTLGSGAPASFAGAIDTAGQVSAGLTMKLVRDGGTLAAVAGVPEGANANSRIAIANVWGTEDPAILQAVADVAADGDLVIPVARTFKLSEAPAAYELLAAGRVGGKIVLVP